MPIDMSQFFEGFFDEVAEHLERIEELIVAVERKQATKEDFNALFRAAHSIKGASGTFGFAEMAALTHVLESVLGRARDGNLLISQELVDVVLATSDVLRQQLNEYRAKRTPSEPASKSIVAHLQRLLDSNATLATTPPAGPTVSNASCAFYIHFHTEREEHQAAAAINALLSTLRELGTCTANGTDGGSLLCTYEGEQTRAEIEDIFAYVMIEGDALEITLLAPGAAAPEEFGFFEDEPPALQASPETSHEIRGDDPGAKSTDSVRVKLHKIDTLINLVGEMLIAQSALLESSQRLDPVEHADFLASVGEFQRHTRDIREAVMSVRMLPIGTVFNRFPRMLRELSKQLGKDVDFATSGDETELDKGLIESISDPLTHIIRNALDHGIESPEERVASGKPARGSIAVRSFQRGGKVVIEVRDDGAGLRRDRILTKAASLGMGVRENMSDQEVWALVCMPGFSTAEVVTDVSGRGVGMDVVKRNITALGGTLEIDSRAGTGTTISLVVPLTLAIQDGLAVRSGHDVYIVPLSAIIESIPISLSDVTSPPNIAPFVMYRDEPLPLLAMPGESCNLTDSQQCIAVVVEAEGKKAGLLVDQLESEHQVVIKSLERNFRRVDGFSGATVLGNGNVALILDVPALLAS